MYHPFPRSIRVADLIHKELAKMLLGEIKDPRVQGLVTVMKVEVSSDLQCAKIFISVHGSESRKKSAIAGLKKAKGFIRRILLHRLDMKRIPEFKFELDRSLDAQEKIERLLAQTRSMT